MASDVNTGGEQEDENPIPDYGLIEEYIRIIEVCTPLAMQTGAMNAGLHSQARNLVDKALRRLDRILR